MCSSDLFPSHDMGMFAISNDELRPVMNGVSFKALPDGTLECCATDAQVLSLVSMPSAVDTESSFIVPRKALSMIKSFIPQGEVEVAVSKGVVLFESATISIYSRLVEGNYPNYKAVIPSSHIVSVDFAKSATISIYSRLVEGNYPNYKAVIPSSHFLS